jgi:hypothetical protein
MSEVGESGEQRGEDSGSRKAEEQAGDPSSRTEIGKRKLWVIIVTVIVAAALVGSAAYVMMSGDEEKTEDLELVITMSPETVPSMPAGTSLALSVNVSADGDAVGKADGVTYLWSVTPAGLASLDFVAQPSATLTAGDVAGEGSVKCQVTYLGVTAVAESVLEVEAPFLDTVSVSPFTKTLLLDQEWNFTATVTDSVGDAVLNASIEWTVSGIDADDYALNTTTGPKVTFSASVEGVATLKATATRGPETLSGDSTVTIASEPEVLERTVDYIWYGMFEPELGPWYEDRWIGQGHEYPLTDSYPYLYLWCGDAHSFEGDTWIYTLMRLNITGRNMTEICMNDNPVFIPTFGDSAGGVAKLDWYLQYVTREEAQAKLSPSSYNWYDGWLIGWNGTITLDEQAAKTMLGITTTEFDNFEDWWATNSDQFVGDWQEWMRYEAGPERLDIWPMYMWVLDFQYFVADAERAGDEVVITFDSISWGMEALMTRWMRESFMPTEWYWDDMDFIATIGSESSDLDVDTAVQYAVYAEISQEDDGALTWGWEGLMQDYLASNADPKEDHPLSLFDPYVGKEYYVWSPGNEYYGETAEYAYTPGAWNLSEGETLVFEWPAGEQMFFDHDPGNINGLVDNTLEVLAPMTVVYTEPLPSEMPGQMSIDTDARKIVLTGPFDMWTWSHDQTAHQNLSDEWERLGGLLPWGVPAIQFKADIGDKLSMDAEGAAETSEGVDDTGSQSMPALFDTAPDDALREAATTTLRRSPCAN